MDLNEREVAKQKDDMLNLENLFELFWKNKFFIIAITLVVALFMLVKTVYFSGDTYTSSGIIYVSSKTANQEVITDSLNSADLIVSRALGLTYLEILKTRSFLEKVSAEVENQYTWKELSRMTNIQSINNTELLKISVTAPTGEEAYKVCTAIFKNAQPKLKEVYKTGTVEVVDPPYSPDNRNGRGTVKNTIIGLLFGFVISIAFVFIRNFFDRKIHSGIEIVRRYDLYLLGELADAGYSKKTDKKKNKNVSKNNAYILNEQSGFDMIETFKSIRTNIMFSIPKSEQGKVVVITSSIPGEGKTTTITNLAITFAQTGAKVLLVDCDLRKSRVHRYLKLERKKGISDLLCGFCTIDEVIKKVDDHNFDVITAGEIPPNPAELFESKEFENAISVLQERYDYIFLDTPPVNVVTDAMIVMQKAHGVVVVARENLTTFDAIEGTIEGINKANANTFGVILLGSEEKRKGYYSSYKNGNYYSRGYRYVYADKPGEEQDIN